METSISVELLSCRSSVTRVNKRTYLFLFHDIAVIFVSKTTNNPFNDFLSSFLPPPFLFFFERKSRLERRRGESSASILTLYHRRVPGDVTSRANSRGSYGNGAANTKPKSIRCTLSPAYCTRRPWGFVVLEVDERERERDRFGRCIDTRGKKDGIRGSGYGAACKCYDPLLCSRSLFVPVLPPRLTRSARWHPWVLGSFAYLPSHGEEG